MQRRISGLHAVNTSVRRMTRAFDSQKSVMKRCIICLIAQNSVSKDTHLVFGIRVGPTLHEQADTISATIFRGTNQRCSPGLGL